jgi:hypothetical protein
VGTDGRTDRQTEKRDKANSCLSQFFEPRNPVPFSHNRISTLFKTLFFRCWGMIAVCSEHPTSFINALFGKKRGI